jgi:lactobin A/cerein 7B family class IIb bacteriocin
MKTLNTAELNDINGGAIPEGAACGLAIGGAVLATAAFGVVGFALTVNKAAAICAIDYLA